jgi:hypothetical protein
MSPFLVQSLSDTSGSELAEQKTGFVVFNRFCCEGKSNKLSSLMMVLFYILDGLFVFIRIQRFNFER